MTNLRSRCDHKERCGASGHYRTKDGIVRCACLKLEMNERKLGAMFCENPSYKTSLIKKTETNLRIEGPLDTTRPHIAGALLDWLSRGHSFVTLDAYRLIEIFLEKDKEFSTTRPVVDAELLIILLGFGDPPNKYLPELLNQVLNRRQMTRKPTWVVMGVDMPRVGHKYNTELQDFLEGFERVGSR